MTIMCSLRVKICAVLGLWTGFFSSLSDAVLVCAGMPQGFHALELIQIVGSWESREHIWLCGTCLV